MAAFHGERTISQTICARSPDRRRASGRMTAKGGGEEPAPVRRLYGRSSGKTLRAGQQRLLAEALPLFSIAPETLAEGRGFAAPPREMWLEIGFGAGEHLVAQAKA